MNVCICICWDLIHIYLKNCICTNKMVYWILIPTYAYIFINSNRYKYFFNINMISDNWSLPRTHSN